MSNKMSKLDKCKRRCCNKPLSKFDPDHKCCCAPRGKETATLPVTYNDVVVDRTFPADDSTITLNVVNTPLHEDAQDVLFIHGYPHSWLSWKNVLGSELADKYNLYAMDIRGFGQSDNPGSGAPVACPVGGNDVWNIDTLARDIAAVITQLGLDRPILVAESLGVTLVADFLRVYGDQGLGGVGGDCSTPTTGPAIGGIVLVGGFPVADPVWFSAATVALVVSGGFFTDEFTRLFPTVQAFANLSTYCKLHREDAEEVVMYDVSNSVASRAGILSIPVPADANVPVWNSVTVPALVLFGDKDAVIKRAAATTLAGLIPNSELIFIECAGHLPQYDEPKKVNRLLERFIESV